MTGADLIVITPWVIFGAGLAVICLWLRPARARLRRPRPPAARSRGPVAGNAEEPPAAGQDPGRPDRPRALS